VRNNQPALFPIPMPVFSILINPKSTSSPGESPGSPNVDTTMGMNKGMEILNQVQNDPGWYRNPLQSSPHAVPQINVIPRRKQGISFLCSYIIINERYGDS